jgi:hypothetical protein
MIWDAGVGRVIPWSHIEPALRSPNEEFSESMVHWSLTSGISINSGTPLAGDVPKVAKTLSSSKMEVAGFFWIFPRDCPADGLLLAEMDMSDAVESFAVAASPRCPVLVVCVVEKVLLENIDRLEVVVDNIGLVNCVVSLWHGFDCLKSAARVG